MRLAAAPQRRCCGVAGEWQRARVQAGVRRALTLSHPPGETRRPDESQHLQDLSFMAMEGAPVFFTPEGYESAYTRGYKEGLLAARQQHLAASLAAGPANRPVATPEPAEPTSDPCPECKDTWWRTSLKALSWRIFSTTTTILLAWVVLGGSKGMRWSDMLKLGGAEFIMKFGTYFLHERAWACITFIR